MFFKMKNFIQKLFSFHFFKKQEFKPGYYEEKLINGKLCYRKSPKGKWQECCFGLNGYS